MTTTNTDSISTTTTNGNPSKDTHNTNNDEKDMEPSTKRTKLNYNNNTTQSTTIASSATTPTQADITTTTKGTEDRSSNKELLEELLNDATILDRVDDIKNEILAHEPYPHGVLKKLLKDVVLKQVVTEMKEHSKVTYKESDLFRMYQSMDMANLDTMDVATIQTTIPTVYKLRNFLYSTEWRNFIEQICNLPKTTLSPISTKAQSQSNENSKSDNGTNGTKHDNEGVPYVVDCAFNCHTTGCHLLCHDDVISTRKVSYILYLTDENWDPTTEGGALELYDSYIPTSDKDEKSFSKAPLRVPETVPSKIVTPEWNSMAFFVVEPGKSFHAVQEVFGNRPRLSLQGWYHASEPPKNMEHATLHRLKKSITVAADDNQEDTVDNDDEEEEDTEGVFHPFESIEPNNDNSINLKEDTEDDNDVVSSPVLSEADKQYLAKYMNPIYLQDDAMNEIRTKFENDSSIQLRQFLLEDPYIQQLQPACENDDQNHRHRTRHCANATTSDDNNKSYIEQYYKSGVTNDWKLIGPSHKQRFLEYHGTGSSPSLSSPSSNTVGDILYDVKNNLLQSAAFRNYLAVITSLGLPEAYRGKIRRFRPALDYTVAHYGLLTKQSVLDATLCFVAGSGMDIHQYMDDDDDDADNGKAPVPKSAVASLQQKPNGDEEPNEADIIWNSGDCGGFECYIAADDDDDDNEDGNDGGKKSNNEAAAEYNASDDTELLSVHASSNTLSLVYRDPGTMRFVKYVNSQAPSSRWDITMEYQVPQDDNNNDEDEQNGNEWDDDNNDDDNNNGENEYENEETDDENEK